MCRTSGILKRIWDGIVLSDPYPQYSAWDRMDGLDRASKAPAKAFAQPG
jgi:hypothetical protein